MRRALVPLLAAAAVATAAVPASAATTSIPAHPKFVSSARMGQWSNGGYVITNNEWNSSAGPQTVWANSPSSWGVESTQSAGNTAVETYPNIQVTYDNVPLSRFAIIRNAFAESMPARAGVDAEAADDIWLNNYNIEVMIWVDNHGQRPAGNVVGHATIFGQHFAVWHGGTDWTFALDHNEKAGQTHILGALRWLTAQHDLAPDVTLTQVDFGWEIASTAGRPLDFTLTRYWLHT
jgi:hypothetical protein